MDQRGGVCGHFGSHIKLAGRSGEEPCEGDGEDVGEEDGGCEGGDSEVSSGEGGEELEVWWGAVVVESEGFGTGCWAGFESFVRGEHALADGDGEQDWLGGHSDDNWEVGEEYFIPEGVDGGEGRETYG